jgi:diaminopimelate decarboxylase
MKLSWKLLKELESRYGDSFYILDFDAFKRNYWEFLNEFRKIYPGTNIAYSYKTNYLPEICKYVDSQSGYAEVVSRMEYDLAVKIGVNPLNIIFNGPYKTVDDLKTALISGSIVNLDSLKEGLEIKYISEKFPGEKMKVGIRCNLEIEKDFTSRFGIDVNSNEFEKVIRLLKGLKNCKISGLHCHLITKKRSASDYYMISSKMLDVFSNYFEKDSLHFIDIGGGFCSRMDESLKKQFDYSIPSFKDYAAAAATPFAEKFPDKSGPQLILEPGMSITADTMKFITKIMCVKKNGSKVTAVASGSIYNVKPTRSNKNLPITVYWPEKRHNKKNLIGSIDISGYTCMEDDYLYKGWAGPISEGDFVVFDNIGAYTIVLKPPFIRPNVPVLSFDSEKRTFEVIKRKEELEDVFATFKTGNTIK